MPRRLLLPLVLALLALTAAPAVAARPAVQTGGASRVTPTTVTLTGDVDPRGRRTTYFFQYGTTTAYGAQTPDVDAGDAANRLVATGDAGSLVPNTTYRYRLVARNADGTSYGRARSFRTARQPLGFSLSATPNVVTPGVPVVLSGSLAGTGNAGRRVTIFSRPFPYTAAPTPLPNQLVTDAAGNFSIPLLGLPISTQFAVVLSEDPAVTSQAVIVPLAVSVTTLPSSTRVRRGREVRFSGSIRPARPGAPVEIQKLTSTRRWQTVATTRARDDSAERSVYGRSVRVPRGGSYRVRVVSSGDVVENVGRSVRITSFR